VNAPLVSTPWALSPATPSAVPRLADWVTAIWPLSSCTPLKSVSWAIRLTSLVSAWNSTFRKLRSVSPRFSDEAWIASTFIRVRMSETVLIAPSAIWSIEFA
jgi:hypothetical protein